jgi:hypothetical protein
MWSRVLRAIQALRCLVQRVLREPVLRSQRRKGALSFQLLAAGNGASHLPGGIGPYTPQPSLACRQDRVI